MFDKETELGQFKEGFRRVKVEGHAVLQQTIENRHLVLAQKLCDFLVAQRVTELEEIARGSLDNQREIKFLFASLQSGLSYTSPIAQLNKTGTKPNYRINSAILDACTYGIFPEPLSYLGQEQQKKLAKRVIVPYILIGQYPLTATSWRNYRGEKNHLEGMIVHGCFLTLSGPKRSQSENGIIPFLDGFAVRFWSSRAQALLNITAQMTQREVELTTLERALNMINPYRGGGTGLEG